MVKAKPLATTFRPAEVRAVLEIARILRSGGDASLVARNPAWENVVTKFQRLKIKMERGEL